MNPQSPESHAFHPKASLHLRYLLEEALQQGYLIESLGGFHEFNRPGYKIIDPRTGREMMIIGQNQYPDLSHAAKYLSKHKFLAYELFRKHGIDTPKTYCFHTLEEFQYIWKESFHENRIVIKPENKGLGKDVFLETDKTAVIKAAQYILEKYKKRGLMQEFVPGHDLRIQVVGGKFFAACRRIPAHVIGNGLDTVEKLIEQKNKEKAIYKAKNLIIITDESHILLREQGLDMHSIPETNRHVRLRKAANIGIGGDPIDVTDQVHHEYYALAEKLSGIFGAKNFAMDFVTEDESKPLQEGHSSLLEINAPSMWGLHHFALGMKRNVALAILDAHFSPETFNPKDIKYVFSVLVETEKMPMGFGVSTPSSGGGLPAGIFEEREEEAERVSI